MDIMTAITHHGLAEFFFSFNESDEPDVNDILLSREQAQDFKNCNILCFTESWVNDDTINIQLATLYWQDRTVASTKTRGGGLCIFVYNSWCRISKEVLSYCSAKISQDKL